MFLIMYMCDVCSLYSIQISNLNTIETNPILPLKKVILFLIMGLHTRAQVPRRQKKARISWSWSYSWCESWDPNSAALQEQCDDLNENSHERLICLKVWTPVGGAVWE